MKKKGETTCCLWNIRMRASKSVRGQGSGIKISNPKAKIQNPRPEEVHISGAEGLYNQSEADRVIRNYTARAMSHPRGVPDKVVITLEKIKNRPLVIPLLPISAVRCSSVETAGKAVYKILSGRGISEKAIKGGISIVGGHKTMRGASLILSDSGRRAEPDRERGVRVSRLGIARDAQKNLSLILSRAGLNITTIKEAVILASKVASCQGIIAELCISDDPDYTTGYVACRELGYVRVPNIKERGSMSGGRVFFIEEKADALSIINYLEKTPVLAGKLPGRKYIISSNETISDTHC